MARKTLELAAINSKLRMLRRLQITLITSTVLCEFGIETVIFPLNSPWTLWQWGISAFAVYSALVGHFFGGKLIRASVQTFAGGVLEQNAFKKWQTAQLLRLSVGGGISCYGVLLRTIFGAAFWQVAPFYAASLILLLLWMPQLPLQSVSD
jgi:hypothetical protein